MKMYNSKELAKKIMLHFDIDITNCMLAEANALNSMLGYPERYKLIDYPKDHASVQPSGLPKEDA